MFIPRAQRSLKRMSSFESIDGVEKFSDIGLPEESMTDSWIGLYSNSESVTENIFFTNQALYVYSNEWRRLAYLEIESLGSQLSLGSVEKDEASQIGITMKNGDAMKFVVNGTTDRFRDYFTVYQFLHRVVGDVKSLG